MRTIPKPVPGEYAPYAIMYIDLLPDDGLVLGHLRNNLDMMKALVGGLPETKLVTPWAEGEWTVKEILAHIIDDERIYTYRALRSARNDSVELPGFDQELFAAESFANGRRLSDIFEEYAAVRGDDYFLQECSRASFYAGVCGERPRDERPRGGLSYRRA